MATLSVTQSTGLHSQSLPTVTRQPVAIEFSKTTTHQFAHERLSSSKEIASYLRQGVRTVQRYEMHSQLPVHRINNTPRSPVFAFKAEIDCWLRTRANHGSPIPASRAERGVSTTLMNTSAELISQCGILQATLRDRMQRLQENLERLQAVRTLCHTSEVPPIATLAVAEAVSRNCE